MPPSVIAELELAVAERDAKLAESDAKIAELQEKLVLLAAQVELLTEKLNQNSNNSHLPPSSDGPGGSSRGARPGKKSSKKSKRKRGGQKGHRGSHRQLLSPEMGEYLRGPVSRCLSRLCRNACAEARSPRAPLSAG